MQGMLESQSTSAPPQQSVSTGIRPETISQPRKKGEVGGECKIMAQKEPRKVHSQQRGQQRRSRWEAYKDALSGVRQSPQPRSPRRLHKETLSDVALREMPSALALEYAMINQPLSEQYRLAALEWVAADEAASLLEETKSATFSEMVGKILDENPKIAVNRAETLVKSSDEYKEFVSKMVLMRTKANRLKVQMEFLRMRFMEQNSREASARAEMRL